MKEEANQLRRENRQLRSDMKELYRFGSIVGKSSGMQKVYELITRTAKSEANVIILGESGTGKELVAKEIHKRSDRCGKPFMTVNCGATRNTLYRKMKRFELH